LSWKRDH